MNYKPSYHLHSEYPLYLITQQIVNEGLQSLHAYAENKLSLIQIISSLF